MSGYPTYQDVKQYLNITTNRDDVLLVTFLNRAILIFEHLARRTFLPVSATKYFNGNSEEIVSWDVLFIRSEDLLSVTSLKINGETVANTEYYLEGDSPYYKIRLSTESDFSFNDYTADPHNTVVVEGVWGYASSVPADVFGAIIRLTAYLYAQKDNAMELDRAATMSNGQVIAAGIPNDIERVAVFYRRIM
jgi:hypothetical protein